MSLAKRIPGAASIAIAGPDHGERFPSRKRASSERAPSALRGISNRNGCLTKAFPSIENVGGPVSALGVPDPADPVIRDELLGAVLMNHPHDPKRRRLDPRDGQRRVPFQLDRYQQRGWR